MSKARTVVVAALEDYGLVPIEANASGTPVVSFGAGGVLDTQVSGKTGVFYNNQTAQDLMQAILEAGKIKWDSAKIRNHALSNFSEIVFFRKITEVIESACDRSIKDLVEPKLMSQIEQMNKVGLN